MANIVKEYIEKAPDKYESFYYELYNKTTDITYGGKHKGFVGDGYWHSSENPQMQDDYQNLEHEWEYYVKHYGDDDYILNMERTILKSNEARKSDKWYNLTNGGEAYPHPDVSTIHQLVDDINSGVYLIEDDTLDKSELKILLEDDKRHQVRTEEDRKREIEIATDIDDVGDTRNCDPVTLLENINGEDQLIDGNTTGQAIVKSKHGTKSEYNLIPYDIGKNLSDGDKDQIGLLLNPKPKKKKWESTPKDWSTSIARAAIDEGRKIRSEENRSSLKKARFNSSQISSIFKDADDLKAMGNLRAAGTPWIQYKLEKNKPLLEVAKSKISKSIPKCLIFSFSAEKYRWEDLMFSFIDNSELKERKRKVTAKIIIHYPKPSSESTWNKKLLVVDEYTRKLCKKFGLSFSGFKYMDTE